MVCYKVCSDIKVGKKKLVFKFGSLQKKHISRHKCNVACFKCVVG
jgi:hypothetical protein